MELIEIKKLVEKHTKRKLNVRNREQDNVYCRALYCKLAKLHTKKSTDKIGKVISRDHATVLHNIKLFDNVIVNYEVEYLKIFKTLDKILKIKTRKTEKILNPDTYYKRRYTELLLNHRTLSYNYRQLKKSYEGFLNVKYHDKEV
mgnify:CR=1 FL=1|tara:strand:- start:1416 stop:1850 length:435 start_codon:yes stop_codon:yes gene_type:complete